MRPSTTRLRRLAIVLLYVLSSLSTIVWSATPAGTVIRNQALATYTDTDGQRVTVTSNIVETLIEQVAGIQLTSDQQQRLSPGTWVRFSHRLQNTGNADDRYSLSVTNTGGSVNLESLSVYADTDGDGIADNQTPIGQSPFIAAGADYLVVVEGRVPASAKDGDTALLQLVAISEFDITLGDQNDDSVSVGAGPAITVVKTLSQASGLSPSAPYTVTLFYENSGDEAAGDVTLIDALPAGMSYVADSARWSKTSIALSDADANDTHRGTNGNLRFCAYDSSCTGIAEAQLDSDSSAVNQVTAIMDLVDAGETGSVTFEVRIDANLAAAYLQNTAEFEYDIAVDSVNRQFSNTVVFEVLPVAGVVANGSTANAINGLNEPVSVISAGQGANVQFDNIIWNTGNDTDTFNIVVDAAGSSFPSGTVWQLLRAGASSPLTDTNSDGIVDTGPVEAGEFSRVVLQLQLPDAISGNNNGQGFDLSKTAQSISDASVIDLVTDHLDEIVANTVDVTNQAPAGSAGALGSGPGPESVPVSTVLADADNRAQFDVYIRHQGSEPDNYSLLAANTESGSSLPSGWRVTFKDPVSSATITSTGTLFSGESRHVLAEVVLPTEAQAGVYGVWFEARSARTDVSDRKHDAVRVMATPSLSLEPSSAAQLEPGGSVVYEHLLVNNGNSTIDDIVLLAQDSRDDWASVVYVDSDGDGTLSPQDQPYTQLFTLLPGESVDVFVKVFAPANATTLQLSITTLTASWNVQSDSVLVQDRSTINHSRVVIRKEQAVDMGCDGAPDTGQEFGSGSLEVAPGNNCVVYRLTASNQGLEPSYNVKIHDSTPAYTRYQAAAQCSRTPCWLIEPAQNQTGSISAETDQLLPGDSYFLQFVVRLD